MDEPSTLCFDAKGIGKSILLYIYYYDTPAAAMASGITEGSGIRTDGPYRNIKGSFTGHKIGEDVHQVEFVYNMNWVGNVPVDPSGVSNIGLVARDGDVCIAMIEHGPPNYVFTPIDKWMLENTAIDVFKRSAVYGMTAVTKPDTPMEPMPVIKPE